ncbi:MAG: hypothetical protein IPK26_01685 [Planctomycetes bacterium]|nr:hypothetical protein [Planctomycetota bacterium]
MKAVAFLTGEGDALLQPATIARSRLPDAKLVLFVRDDDRAVAAAAFPDAELRRDKATGGKLAFVRALRAERFDLTVVAWQGGERTQPMKLVALLAGGVRTFVLDRRGRQRLIRWWQPWTWAGLLLQAAMNTDPLLVVAALCAAYRMTIGVVVAVPWLVWPARSASGGRDRRLR